MKKTLYAASITFGIMQFSPAAVLISEVDLAANRVEIVNTGASTEDISTWWWCNRVNGSPFYSGVGASSTVVAGLSSPGASLAALGAGDTIVLDLTAGFLPDTNGELGLYNTNSFSSTTAIEDYLLWGANGVRDLTAQGAGLWIDNDFIDVSGLAAGETLQVSLGTEGDSASEWLIAPSTMGSANIPEPTAASLALIGLLGLARRRR